MTRKTNSMSYPASEELGKCSIFVEVVGDQNLSKIITKRFRELLLKLNLDPALTKQEITVEATKDGQKETLRSFYSLYVAPNSESTE